MHLVDSHSHLSMTQFEGDREAVINRAEKAGLTAIIDVGTDVISSESAVRLAETFPIIHAAAGIHPHEAAKENTGDLFKLLDLWKNPKVVAIGEIGLDYHYDFSPRDVQRDLFRRQLTLAVELNMPVIIHVREAMKDALEDIDSVSTNSWKGVFHCFGGSKQDVDSVLNRGFFISFTGVVTFKNFKQTEAVLAVPTDKLLLETDCPFMTPVPYRGKRNEPAYVRQNLDFLSVLRDENKVLLAEKTTDNCYRLFGLEPVF